MVWGMATPVAWKTLLQTPRRWLQIASLFPLSSIEISWRESRSCLTSAHSKSCPDFSSLLIQFLPEDKGQETAKYVTMEGLIKMVKDGPGTPSSRYWSFPGRRRCRPDQHETGCAASWSMGARFSHLPYFLPAAFSAPICFRSGRWSLLWLNWPMVSPPSPSK